MFIHIDIDTFFASAHRIGTNIYDDIPIAVGGRSNLSIFDTAKQNRKISGIAGAFSSSILSYNKNKSFEEYFIDKDGRIRGIVTTASYEARAYGVKTAMSISEALKLCPDLIVLPPNYPLYHELSYQLKKLLEKNIPIVSQFSIDEFFCDISGYIDDDKAVAFALNLQALVYRELEIPVSIGICKAKMLSKVATNYAKPYGVKYIQKNQINEFIKNINISKFPGIGKGYFKKLSALNIKNLIDIKQHKATLYSWGKQGIWLYQATQGLDTNTLVIDNQNRKSISISRTFDAIYDRDEIQRRLAVLCRHISFLCQNRSLYPTCFELKFIYEHGLKNRNNHKIYEPYSEIVFRKTIKKLFNDTDTNISRAITYLNITVSKFHDKKAKNTLFEEKSNNIDIYIHTIRQKYGIDMFKFASELNNLP